MTPILYKSSSTSPPARIDLALWYAERGVKVFPGSNEPGFEKQALVAWGDGATTDPGTIRQWWAKWPEAWVMAPVAALGTNVVVFDSLPGQAPGGVEGTPVVKTPHGWHVYFSTDRKIKTSEAKAAFPWVECTRNSGDLTGNNGNVVALPGNPGYEVIVDAPLKPFAPNRTRVKVGASESPLEIDPASEERNNDLTRAAGKLMASGLSVEQAKAALIVLNSKFDTPLSLEELGASIFKTLPAWEENEPDPITWETFGLSVEDVEAMTPPAWLVDGLIPSDTLTELVGPPGTYKSFLALEWSMRLAQKGSRILYIAAEGIRGQGKRIGAWRSWYVKGAAPWMSNLRFLDKAVCLLDSKAVGQLCAALEQVEGVDLVVVDTLARSVAGGDENSAKDMTLAVDSLGRIKDAASSTVLVVHHMGWEAQRQRGSSALQGAWDSVIHVKKFPPSEGNGIRVVNNKQKDFEEAPDRGFLFQPHDNSGVLIELTGPPPSDDDAATRAFCAVCGSELTGRQRMYCGTRCKNEARNGA